MKKQQHMLNNETGSLMVIAVVLLMLLTIIGLAITTTTSIELQIAGNDRIHKTTFYAADGATDVSSELLEQNLGCVTGFGETDSGPPPYADIGTIRVFNLNFWQNTETYDATEESNVSETNRDFFFPATAGADSPHTNLNVGGDVRLSTGAAIQMVSGYEGKGKAVGAGGAYLAYNIFSQHLGVANSESIIQVQWRHMIGQEGGCIY
jgi:PilX N-terminal